MNDIYSSTDVASMLAAFLTDHGFVVSRYIGDGPAPGVALPEIVVGQVEIWYSGDRSKFICWTDLSRRMHPLRVDYREPDSFEQILNWCKKYVG